MSTAIHLRYSIPDSSLSEKIKERLMALSDQRIKANAIEHLQALVDSVAVLPKRRKATNPTKSSQRRRLEGKAVRGDVKKLRGRVSGGD